MHYDLIIIGGGITGLATALKVNESRPGLKIAVLEKESGVARHQTGNNSGVIHSGIYYKPGSLKATNCIRGYHQLIDFCTNHNVPFERCGKIIVATSEAELPLLENIHNRGIANGLDGLHRLSAGELREHEPHVAGIAGIFVPQTGIVDYRLVAEKYAELLKERGIHIHLNT
ncbi:MAG: FAD-dependent oxidoreductase, partial [Bacteroidota bacterium]